MEVYKLTILEPEAMDAIHRLEEKGSVRLQKIGKGKKKSNVERRAFYLSAPVLSDVEFQRLSEIRSWMNAWRTK